MACGPLRIQTMFLLHAIIFSTGGAILALELLASRIMTPYFGVSIYIWTGILSITLIALAAGYALQLLLGALHGGWCVNPVNLLSQAEQMRYVLDHSDCKLVLASGEWQRWAGAGGWWPGLVHGRHVSIIIQVHQTALGQ